MPEFHRRHVLDGRCCIHQGRFRGGGHRSHGDIGDVCLPETRSLLAQGREDLAPDSRCAERTRRGRRRCSRGWPLSAWVRLPSWYSLMSPWQRRRRRIGWPETEHDDVAGGRCALADGVVGPMGVVVLDVLVEHTREMSAVPDEGPVASWPFPSSSAARRSRSARRRYRARRGEVGGDADEDAGTRPDDRPGGPGLGGRGLREWWSGQQRQVDWRQERRSELDHRVRRDHGHGRRHLAADGHRSIIGIPLTAGNQVYFDALNAKGGIAGKYKVNLEVRDSAYNSNTAQQDYSDLRNNVAMLAQVLGTDITNALLTPMRQDDMVELRPPSTPSGYAIPTSSRSRARTRSRRSTGWRTGSTRVAGRARRSASSAPTTSTGRPASTASSTQRPSSTSISVRWRSSRPRRPI